MKNNKKGFTIVELVVTCTITAILAAVAIISIVEYSKYARFKQANEYAQQLFSAAQMQMTYYQQHNDLEELQTTTASNLVDYGTLTAADGKAVTAEAVWKDSDPLYQGELRYVIGTKSEWQKYQAGKLDKEKQADLIALYDLFDSYLYDKTILNGTICVEFDPYEGLVYSVLYSTDAKDFTYSSGNDSIVNICDRTKDYRYNYMIGYYGIDTMSKSTVVEIRKPIISNVVLHNEDTLKITYNLSKITEALPDLNYEVMVYDADEKKPLLTIQFNDPTLNTSTLDTANYHLVAGDAKNVTHTIQAYVKSNNNTEFTNGMYTFPAWIDDTGTVHFVLDAVDMGATTVNYNDKHMSNTFSLHRFGLGDNNIYCTVQGSAEGYRTTAKRQTNTENPYYEKYTYSAGSYERTYAIANARHLFNTRFSENDNTGTGKYIYSVTDDFSWATLIKNNTIYKDQTTLTNGSGLHWVTADNKNSNRFTDDMLKISESDSDVEKAFPSIKALNKNSTLVSAGHSKTYTISGLIIRKDKNAEQKVSLMDKDATGLYLINLGNISNIDFDKVNVSGKENVGAICGINRGDLGEVSVLNTGSNSIVTGTSYVGGIAGDIEVPQEGETVFDKLVNRAEVIGYAYVGGIFSNINASTDSSITLSNSRNYGRVHGIKDPSNAIASRYVGGICGYTCIKNNGKLTLSSCNSSPQYSDGDIFNAGKTSIEIEKIGIFVGGIVGYNDGATINKCSTVNENGKSSYVVGDSFVGGIVGFNNGNAGALEGENGYNQANVIGNTYVGGIVGANAVLDESGRPITTYNSQVKLSNWINQGVVASTGNYSGGIAGFNSGIIDGCICDVSYDNRAQSIINASETNGDYAGGIAGYNNGKIYSDTTLSVATVISGNNFVGGIVGYNDNGSDCQIKNYELQGGYIYGNIFVGGYTGINTTVSLIEDNKQIVANPNAVSGKYCVAGIIGANIVDAKSDISTRYNTYNILGNVSGNCFVGGFIGYNLMTDSNGKIQSAISEITSGMTAQSDHNIAVLNGIQASSNYVFEINGNTAELRSIKAKVCVGGVIGFNGNGSYLYVKDVTNKTPIHASDSLEANEVPNMDNQIYAYAGGVIGEVNSTVIIDNCKNEGVGEVTASGSYVGGIAEINKGLVVNCTAVNLGNVDTNNLGGIIGVNYQETTSTTFGTDGYVNKKFEGEEYYKSENKVSLGVYNCKFTGTVTGKNNVGGLVAYNDGMIYKPIVTGGKINAYGKNVGGITGKNMINGQVIIGKTIDISIGGSATNVGGAVGINYGQIKLTDALISKIEKNGDDLMNDLAVVETVKSGNSIIGKKNVGGIIGQQISGNLTYFVNGADIVATGGNAGGISGSSDSNASFNVKYCINKGQIQATSDGDAGGIIASLNKNCSVSFSWNGNDITAANGQCGGISGVNSGIIKYCNVTKYKESSDSGVWGIVQDFFSSVWNWIVGVFSGEDSDKIYIEADINGGGVAAVNNNEITNCTISDIKITNLSNSGKGSYLGGIAGNNTGTINVSDDSLEKISVQTYSERCCIGGLIGYNSGNIIGRDDNAEVGSLDDKLDISFASSAATVGSLGGLAGRNKGNISGIKVFANVIGNKGDSNNPTFGYGGISGVNDGNITKCSFDGSVYADGNSSFIGCVGGISGINSGNIRESTVGITSNSNTVVQCGISTSAYGYVGGVAGLNKGIIKSCDNYVNSNAQVYIINYAGHTGGLVGRNGNKASISGVKTAITSTGSKWSVIIQHYDNDCGGGGIMGYSASGENIRYVSNYANVYYVASSSNVSVGGMIGRIENSESTTMTVAYCENHGNIMSLLAFNGGFMGTVKYNAITFRYCSNYGQVGSDKTQNVTYYNYDGTKNSVSFQPKANASTGLVARMYQLSDSSISGAGDGHNSMSFYSCNNYGDLYGSKCGGIMAFMQDSSSAYLYFSDCVNTGNLYSTESTVSGIASNVTSANNVKLYRCRNYGLCKSGRQSYFAGIYSGSVVPKVMTDCVDCSNATIYPITNLSNSSNFTENYFVAQNAYTTTVNENVWQKAMIDSASLEPLGSGTASVQSGYPLTNGYDDRQSTKTYIKTTGRATSMYTAGSNSSFSLIYTMKEPMHLSNIGLCWGVSYTESRRYTYRLYYTTEDDNTWHQVTSTRNEGSNDIAYDSVHGCYLAYATSNNANSTFYHKLDELNDSEKIVKVRVELISSASASRTSYSYNTATYLNEVMPITDETYTQVSNNGGYNVAVGYPLAPGGSEGNYTLSSNHSMNLEGITENPKNGYPTDFSTNENSDSSPRYKLHSAIEDAVSLYYSQKYGDYQGTIEVHYPEDDGNCAYQVKWTSTVTAMEYELSYKIVDLAGNVLLESGRQDNTIRSRETKATISIPTTYAGNYVTFQVRAVGYGTDENGNYVEKYSDWANAPTIMIKEPLPTPQIRLQLVKSGTDYKYKVVLDNKDDYVKYTPQYDRITVKGPSYTATFYASDGESDPVITIGNTGNNTITYQATDDSATYGNSAKRTVQTKVFSPKSLNDTDYVNTSFNGFFGNTVSDLYYSLTVSKLNAPETYYYLELLSYDSELGNDIASSYSESHVTEYGHTLTASLSNLPTDLVQSLVDDADKKVTVRTYPWRTQAYMCYFGETVAESVSIDKIKQMNIFDNGVLKPGYVIQKNIDGTYNVIYSIILENEYYFKIQVDKTEYRAVNENGTYYIESDTNNYKVPVQPVPEISETYDHSQRDNSYTFYWDRDKNYTNASYNVTLIGIAKDGSKVELDSTTTEQNSITYVDTNWNYPNFELKVERVGESDDNGVIKFASLSSRNFNLKIRFDQITAPTVSLHSNQSGLIEKDELIYDVAWNGIENDELNSYQITINHKSKDGDITKIVFDTDTGKGIVYYNGTNTGEVIDFTVDSPTATNAVINLNYLAKFGGDDIEISVKAIAKEDAVTYRNSLDGVVRTITLPSRLATPRLENMTCDANDVMSVKDFVNDGVTLTMKQEYEDKGSYEMVVEVVDKDHKHIADILYNNKVVSKSNPIQMAGNLLEGTYNLNGIATDYAGMYLKVSLRAVADSNISSVWTDADDNVESFAYFRLPKVQIEAPAIAEGITKITYTNGSDQQVDWSYFDQVDLEFNPVQYADGYNITIIGCAESANLVGDVYKKMPIYNLHLIKKDDKYKVMIQIPEDSSVQEETTEENTSPEPITDINGETLESQTQIETISEIITSSQTQTTEAESETEKPTTEDDVEEDFRNETYLATLGKGDEVEIPYYVTIYVTENEVSQTIKMHAVLKIDKNGKIIVVLPDSEDVDLQKTQNVIFKAEAENQECYTDSTYSTWYRDTVNNVDVTVISGFANLFAAAPVEAADYNIGTSIRTGFIYDMTLTANYRTVIELSADTDNDDIDDVIRTYTVPGYEMTKNVQSLLLLNKKDWKDFEGKQIKIRTRYIINNFGLSKWSDYAIVQLPKVN